MISVHRSLSQRMRHWPVNVLHFFSFGTNQPSACFNTYCTGSFYRRFCTQWVSLKCCFNSFLGHRSIPARSFPIIVVNLNGSFTKLVLVLDLCFFVTSSLPSLLVSAFLSLISQYSYSYFLQFRKPPNPPAAFSSFFTTSVHNTLRTLSLSCGCIFNTKFSFSIL